jgi:hypothetical protein
MALDGPLTSDETFMEKGVKFIIDKELYEKQTISVDSSSPRWERVSS